jgi:hypothetical protein
MVMDPIFAIMLDVVRIVTFLPNVANTDARCIAREREPRSTDTVTAGESAPATADATKQEPVRLSRRFRFLLMPR